MRIQQPNDSMKQKWIFFQRTVSYNCSMMLVMLPGVPSGNCLKGSCFLTPLGRIDELNISSEFLIFSSLWRWPQVCN